MATIGRVRRPHQDLNVEQVLLALSHSSWPQLLECTVSISQQWFEGAEKETISAEVGRRFFLYPKIIPKETGINIFWQVFEMPDTQCSFWKGEEIGRDTEKSDQQLFVQTKSDSELLLLNFAPSFSIMCLKQTIYLIIRYI